MTHTQCCDLCEETDTVAGYTKTECGDPVCVCHTTSSVDTPPPTDTTATPYSKIDHSHCWTKDKPPCGQRIEHYKCCLCEELNPLVALAVKNREEEIVEKLQNWLEHDYRCSLKQFYEQFSAGRPTEDGGYEQKWDGKWYQSRPVDELPKPPKCDCGLDDSLSLLTQK